MISNAAMTFAEHGAHFALIFMAIVYTLRIRWFLGFTAGKERQAPTGTGMPMNRRSIWYSLANIAMPWAMESTRRKWFLYLQFVLFHLGVIAAITLTFTLPFAEKFMADPSVILLFQAAIGAAFVVGLMRIVRRIGNKYMRAISTPDDHFSLWLLTIWFGFGVFAAPNHGGLPQFLYFWMTTLFLVYVPFSKISHYLYYPFTRYHLGRSMGRRGVYPLKRSVRA